MNYCFNCGEKIQDVKFCPNCGVKIDTTNIQNLIDKNINSFNRQVKESVVVNRSLNGVMSFLDKVSDLLGVIGFVIIIGQIILYIGNKKQLHYLQAYSEYKNNLSGNHLPSFIGEILPTTILPFIFMAFLSLKRHRLMLATLLLLLFFIVSSQIR